MKQNHFDLDDIIFFPSTKIKRKKKGVLYYTKRDIKLSKVLELTDTEPAIARFLLRKAIKDTKRNLETEVTMLAGLIRSIFPNG